MENTKIEMEFQLDKYLKDLAKFLTAKLNSEEFKDEVASIYEAETENTRHRYGVGARYFTEQINNAAIVYGEEQKPHKKDNGTRIEITLGVPDPKDKFWAANYGSDLEGVKYHMLVFIYGVGSRGLLHTPLRYHEKDEIGWDNYFEQKRPVKNPTPYAGQLMPDGMNQAGRPDLMDSIRKRVENLLTYLAITIWLPEFYEDPKHQLVNYITASTKG